MEWGGWVVQAGGGWAPASVPLDPRPARTALLSRLAAGEELIVFIEQFLSVTVVWHLTSAEGAFMYWSASLYMKALVYQILFLNSHWA